MADGFVNPWGGFYQGQQALSNAADFRQRQQQIDRQNALYDRRMAQEDKQMGQADQANEIKLIGIQAETIGRALDSVKDEQSHQAYRSFLGQIAQTPMGQGKFFQTLVQRTPERFDPQSLAQGKAMLNSLRQQVAVEGFTLGEGQKRFDSSGNLIASGPEKRTEAPASYREWELAGRPGTYAEWAKTGNQTLGDPADEMTDDEIAYHANMYNLRGVMPALGMGKSPLRIKILKKAAELGGEKGAATILEGQATMAGLKGSIAQQEKQLGSMGSFVNNLSQQVDKVKDLSKELAAFDTRLLNVPLRMVRGRLAGSAEQAKYDMYLAEIESEIGKLATGSTGSVAELSIGAQERWSRIHDKNLSLSDMLSLLEETKNAGNMRLKSVKDQLEDTRKRMRETGQDKPQESKKTDAGSYLQKFEDK